MSSEARLEKYSIRDVLNRALRRSLRQTHVLSVERFRCKEPMSDALIEIMKAQGARSISPNSLRSTA